MAIFQGVTDTFICVLQSVLLSLDVAEQYDEDF